MASTTITMPGKTIKGFAGKQYPIPMYLQFVPGSVVDVVHSKESLSYKGDHTINTIIAKPNISGTLYNKKALSVGNEEHRYYPLLRSHGDIPSKGDPVLLCTINKTNFYLGPLNTITNSTTWNDDPSYKPELALPIKEKNKGWLDERGRRGESKNFNTEINYRRLTKKRKEDLDYGKVVNEVTGDYLIEGRHGNSVRIGSRSNNPYIFISNKRDPNFDIETLSDGGLISITSNGTLQQHFGSYTDNTNNRVDGFILSSDSNAVVGSRNLYMGDLYKQVNGAQDTNGIYGYGNADKQNQILFSSDRITINTKRDDILLSSVKDIHIGTGRHLTISTNQDLYINSNKTFLGKNASQPMVLGNELIDILKETLALLQEGAIFMFSPIPLTNLSGKPLAPEFIKLGQKLDKILSSKHFIEQ